MHTLGIDIGSVAISLALLDTSGRIMHSAYDFHNGRIKEKLHELLEGVPLQKIDAIGYTSSTPPVLKQGKSVDSRVAYITAAKHYHPDLRTLLIIGAEKFGLVTFNEKGEYLNFKSNTSCAAGTGNFLDQQAERLNLKDILEFSDVAYRNKGNFPKIASRCAVFAKTDLIHAQQEGYSLCEICDGLSYGLAKNIVDAVFHSQKFSHVLAAGGVAMNKAVIRHIEQLTGLNIIVDEYANIYGAVGAAMNSREEDHTAPLKLEISDVSISGSTENRKYVYPPLQLHLSDYPDFGSHNKYEFRSILFPLMKSVEVDVYCQSRNEDLGRMYLGIDIGSTSTKAVLLDGQKKVVAGFYTRTSGQPVQAVQLLFEAILEYARKEKVKFIISAAGTTGSGRKFTGRIIGADLMLDEITAHAKAASELDPNVDTIIEIGGQDSKFTVMRNGVVTFSIMNSICAAGTGSFIEEQAKRLSCPLQEYEQRVQNAHAPLSSDRCTVFMERDLNHYLMAGYSSDEILAAVLHATRENYLSKVAVKGYIGDQICFQGATAKNKALVAAFEQKLRKPIKVSKYCHLTGALGVALELYEQKIERSKFRGLGLYSKQIPVRSEVCDLCTNHCKIKLAAIDSQIEAYGFLCGRDYHQQKYVKLGSSGFQLISERKKSFKFKATASRPVLTIGIPAGLHMYDEILFWRKFFDQLSIRTITSEKYQTPVQDGKNLWGAEFCAPIAAMHGHIDFLSSKVDYIFLPTYLKDPQVSRMSKQYCYYTQFVTSVISVHDKFKSGIRLLTPLLKYSQGELAVQLELYRMLRSIGIENIALNDLSIAFEHAKNHVHSVREKWKQLYRKEIHNYNDIHIMLLGRPYTVLSQAMNSNIPEIIEKTGVKAFYMDMLPEKSQSISQIDELLKTIRWKFATNILAAAEVVAKMDGCYPLLVTSFKCTPDAFVIEYFKEMLEAYQKPYLILQLDEHDSAVGYETRIEAGIRAFRNHFKQKVADVNEHQPDPQEKMKQIYLNTNRATSKAWQVHFHTLSEEASHILRSHAIDFKKFSKLLQQKDIKVKNDLRLVFSGSKHLKNKTLLLPSWDPYVGPLLEAVLLNSGIDAKLVDGTNDSIQRSLSFNTGQCIPLNIIVQNAIEYIDSNGLDPDKTVLWMTKSSLSCNLSMFPYYMKKLLDNHGNGMEKVAVYQGDVVFSDVSLATAINAYLAYMFGGYVRKIGCRMRPYEVRQGMTDDIIRESLSLLYKAFRNGYPKEEVLHKIIRNFNGIETTRSNRPKVAIFGDLYVRDNDLMNQDLIRTIEAYGGEVITTPYSEYMKIIVDPHTERSLREGRYKDYIKIKFLRSLIPLVEEKYKKYFEGFMGEEVKAAPEEIDEWLGHFGMNILHRGESIENILKIHSLIRQYPDLDLFIQTNPSYCCPSLVTEAMKSRIEEITGVPVVTIEYDGTAGIKNESIIPYLRYRRKRNLTVWIP